MADIDKWLETLRNGKCISERDLHILCERVKEILSEEPNVQHIQTPITICSDIHGQYHELMGLIRNEGDITITNYLFMVISIKN